MRSPTTGLGLTFAAVFFFLALLPWSSSSAPLPEAGAGVESVPATAAGLDEVGWVSVHNETGGRVRISYRAGHDGHWRRLGRVGRGHTKRYSLQECDHQFNFRATDKHQNHWDEQLQVQCGHTVTWRVAGHHR